MADTGRPPRYVAEDGTGYAEVTQVFAGPDGRLTERPVIRHDGHCLIASIYYLQTRGLIPPERVAAYRERIARELPEHQIRELAGNLVLDTLREVRELSESGQFSGLGPAVSQALRADERFRDYYREALQQKIAEQARLLSLVPDLAQPDR